MSRQTDINKLLDVCGILGDLAEVEQGDFKLSRGEYIALRSTCKTMDAMTRERMTAIQRRSVIPITGDIDGVRAAFLKYNRQTCSSRRVHVKMTDSVLDEQILEDVLVGVLISHIRPNVTLALSLEGCSVDMECLRRLCDLHPATEVNMYHCTMSSSIDVVSIQAASLKMVCCCCGNGNTQTTLDASRAEELEVLVGHEMFHCPSPSQGLALRLSNALRSLTMQVNSERASHIMSSMVVATSSLSQLQHLRTNKVEVVLWVLANGGTNITSLHVTPAVDNQNVHVQTVPSLPSLREVKLDSANNTQSVLSMLAVSNATQTLRIAAIQVEMSVLWDPVYIGLLGRVVCADTVVRATRSDMDDMMVMSSDVATAQQSLQCRVEVSDAACQTPFHCLRADISASAHLLLQGILTLSHFEVTTDSLVSMMVHVLPRMPQLHKVHFVWADKRGCTDLADSVVEEKDVWEATHLQRIVLEDTPQPLELARAQLFRRMRLPNITAIDIMLGRLESSYHTQATEQAITGTQHSECRRRVSAAVRKIAKDVSGAMGDAKVVFSGSNPHFVRHKVVFINDVELLVAPIDDSQWAFAQ